MVSISLCMIVKDEEAVLARCLDSVQGIADEIIIVDTGSSDQTRAIASQYGRVLDFAWCNDFSAARNYSFAQAGCDYIPVSYTHLGLYANQHLIRSIVRCFHFAHLGQSVFYYY